MASDKITHTDKIEYIGLDTSRWYVFEGTLIVKDTGDPVMENGDEVTVMSEPFKPSKANGDNTVLNIIVY